jgi:Mg-chelatase subunit ChlD
MSDPERTEREQCNTETCTDYHQTCSESNKVVLAIDSSGSLTEEGFTAVRSLATALAEAFKKEVDEHSADVKLGAIAFGNGEVDEDGTMPDAEHVSDLSTDLAAVGKTLEGLKWHSGVTNMAQGLLKAEQALGLDTKADGNGTHSTVILITDGRPAFRVQVDKVGKQLRSRARIVVVQVQQFPIEENVNLLKGFASEPPDSNYLLIRGKDQLGSDMPGYAKAVVARACQGFHHPQGYDVPFAGVMPQ